MNGFKCAFGGPGCSRPGALLNKAGGLRKEKNRLGWPETLLAIPGSRVVARRWGRFGGGRRKEARHGEGVRENRKLRVPGH